MKFDYAHYDRLLEVLQEGRVCSIYPERQASDKPRFLLRHDIDYGLEFLGRMPEMESARGIRATYFIQVRSDWYNPFSTAQAATLDWLLRLGHRLGLHADCQETADEDALREQIEREMSLLKAGFGKVDAVSFHHPPAAIIENHLRIGYVNAYDREDMRGFEYMSDSCQRWSKGDPIDLLRRSPEHSYQVLVHPALWALEESDFRELAKRSVLDKADRLYRYLRQHARGMDEPLRLAYMPEGS